MSNVRPQRTLLVELFLVTFSVLFTIYLLYALRVLNGFSYSLIWTSAVVIVTLFALWQAIRARSPGFAISSEKSLHINEPYDKICRVIPTVVSRNHWKMQQADPAKGRFVARIGMSMHTFSSTFIVDIDRIAANPVDIYVTCQTGSANGRAHCDKMIAKFLDGLKDTFKENV